MRVLFVYAHHEPKSLTAALLARGRAELEALGHEVRVSDLPTTSAKKPTICSGAMG